MELVGGGIFEEHAVVALNVYFLHAEVVVVLQEVEDGKLPWAGVGTEQLRPCGELQDGGATRRKAAARASSLPQAQQVFDDSMTAQRCDASSGGAIGEDAGTAMRRAAGRAGFFFLFRTTNCAGRRLYRPASAKPISGGGCLSRPPAQPHLCSRVGIHQHRWPFVLAHECWRALYTPAQIVFSLVALRPCFVRLVKPAAASAFSLALLHLRPLLARERHQQRRRTPRPPLLHVEATSPAVQPCAPPCVPPSRAPPPGAIIDRCHASWRYVPWFLRSLGLARRTRQIAAATFHPPVGQSCCVLAVQALLVSTF